VELETEVALLVDWRENTVDPKLASHSTRLTVVETNQSEWKGSVRVIIWLNGIILSLVIVLLGTLFGWGLSHVTLRVESASPSTIGAVQSPQDAALPVLR